MIWVLSVIFAAVCYLLWSAVHEYSHLFAARAIVGVRRYAFKLYPHIYNGRWYWSRVSYLYERNPDDREQAWISIAPRYADLVAAIALPFAALMPDVWLFHAWTILFGAGVVDLWTGSTGISKTHDLRKASVGFEISPWLLRAGGLIAIASSIAVWLLFLPYYR